MKCQRSKSVHVPRQNASLFFLLNHSFRLAVIAKLPKVGANLRTRPANLQIGETMVQVPADRSVEFHATTMELPLTPQPLRIPYASIKKIYVRIA